MQTHFCGTSQNSSKSFQEIHWNSSLWKLCGTSCFGILHLLNLLVLAVGQKCKTLAELWMGLLIYEPSHLSFVTQLMRYLGWCLVLDMVDSGRKDPHHHWVHMTAFLGSVLCILVCFHWCCKDRATLILLLKKVLHLCSLLDSAKAPWRSSKLQAGSETEQANGFYCRNGFGSRANRTWRKW